MAAKLEFRAFVLRAFIAMPRQGFGDCLSATIAPSECLKTVDSCTMDRAKPDPPTAEGLEVCRKEAVYARRLRFHSLVGAISTAII